MILKEHPLRYTATEIRRSIQRLETYAEINPNEAASHKTETIIDLLKNVYRQFPKEYQK